MKNSAPATVKGHGLTPPGCQGTALLIIGIREVPTDAIIGKLTGGLSK